MPSHHEILKVHHHSSTQQLLFTVEGWVGTRESGVKQDHGSSSRELTCKWTSFTSRFTQQFEELKVEVGDLWTEVKLLKRTVREFKVRKKGAALNVMLITSMEA